MNNRIDYIDLAKGICIMMVVFLHCTSEGGGLPLLEKKICTFRMPLYFILSGLFFKEYSGLVDFLKRKTNKLLIPFLTFYFIIGVVMSYLYNFYFHYQHNVFSLQYLFAFYYEHFNNMSNAIWFLLCLFEVNAVFYLLVIVSNRTCLKDIMICLLSLLLGGLGYILGIYGVNLPLWIDTTFSVIPFFCFGYFLKQRTHFLCPNDYDGYNICFIVFCCIVIFFLGERVSYIDNYFSISFPSVYICGMLGSVAVLVLSKEIQYIPLVSYVGRYSIIVLIVHHPLVKLLDAFLFWRWSWLYNNTFLKFFIVMFITIGFIPLMRRYLPYVTAQKDLIKVKS